MGELMLNLPLKSRKIATVRVSALARMQMRRVHNLRSNAEIFESCAEAEAWLAER